MQTIVIKKGLEVGLEDLAQRLSQLDTLELTAFFVQLNEKILGHPQVNRLSQESILLRKIKHLIPASILRQYRNLRKKAKEQGVSETEKQELLLLSDFIEEKTVEKINLLAELARLKQVPLHMVFQQFTIQSLA
jgi:uncharacterized protein YnzC (UPF0291/DUF896 family)